MTNKEYVIKLLQESKYDELFPEVIARCGVITYNSPCQKHCGCIACQKEWFEAKRDEPMPVLENGVFIKVKYDYMDEEDIGVVVGDHVVYKSGGFDELSEVDEWGDNITSIYKATSFGDFEDGNDLAELVWERGDAE